MTAHFTVPDWLWQRLHSGHGSQRSLVPGCDPIRLPPASCLSRPTGAICNLIPNIFNCLFDAINCHRSIFQNEGQGFLWFGNELLWLLFVVLLIKYLSHHHLSLSGSGASSYESLSWAAKCNRLRHVPYGVKSDYLSGCHSLFYLFHLVRQGNQAIPEDKENSSLTDDKEQNELEKKKVQKLLKAWGKTFQQQVVPPVKSSLWSPAFPPQLRSPGEK